jgi:hypothetical protein
VLAQDVESGELAYKPVLAVTLRQPRLWMKVGLGKESIIATPSHPFWTSGEGWQMTKQLATGQRIHALRGGVLVEKVETLDAKATDVATTDINASPAYNLIVADFNTYFVGQQGILVHDISPRKATAALLPGFLNSAEH